MYQSFNVFFTGAAVIWYSTFDWEHTKEKLLSDPFLYKIGLKNYCFNKFIFFRWYFYAVWQSALIVFLTLKTLEQSNDSYKGNAISGSMMLDSTFMIQAIVILVTVKITISTNTHTWFSLACYTFGIVTFFLMFAIESAWNKLGSELFGMINVMFVFNTQYYLLFFIMVGFILVDYGMEFIDLEIQRMLEKFEQDVIKKKQKRIKKERLNKKQKLTAY